MAEAFFHLATVLYGERAQDMALLFVRYALELRPEFPMARILLGEILKGQERWEEAIAAYKELPPDTAYGWQARLGIAESLDSLDRTEEAISTLRQMVAENPERADAAIVLGNLLRAHERWTEAVEAYDTAVERLGEVTPNNWSLLYFRGIALERSDQWPRAEKDFLRALELEPDHPFVMNYLAYSWVEKGENYDRALNMLKRAVDLRPEDGFIVDSLGWVFYRLGRYEEAVEQLERAVELRPQDPVLNDHLGDAYWKVGRKREARFQWERALAFDPEEKDIPRIQGKLANGLTPSGS
jgi:tetratricopeptide (TPR) repeat protein